MTEYFYRRGYLHERIAIMSGALAAATRIDDTLGQAISLRCLGSAFTETGNYDQAREFCEQSLGLVAKLGGLDVEYGVRDTLGYIALHTGDFAEAAAHFEFALDQSRHHGHRSHEADILAHLGDARYAAGELPQARQAWQQALAIYDDIDHPDTDKIRAKLASMKE